MFSKVFGWFARKPAEEIAYNVYHPKERLLYRYWDGKKMREADPLVLYRRIMDVRPQLSADMTAATTDSKFAADAHKNMIASIRKIFEVEPMDTGGLSEGETLGLLDHYMLFAETIKKNSGDSPTSPATTSPSTPPSSNGSQATSNTSDSGSTANGSKIAEPTPSPTVQASPSA